MNFSGQKTNKLAFTIVELLVVIVVIGILAAITIVSYSNISNKAIGAGLQSDLSSGAKLLKMYNVEYGYYPSSLDGNNCPLTPDADTRYCLKASTGATLTYNGSGQSFTLKAKKNGIIYIISENGTPIAATAPIVDYNTQASITATTATIGATIVSDGGDDVTSAGMCWGLTANPTTNCQQNIIGALSSATPASIYLGVVNPFRTAISDDGAFLYSINAYVDNMTIYSRSAVNGSLTNIGSIATGDNPQGIAISPDDAYLYVSNIGSGDITIYSRNKSTGALNNIGTRDSSTNVTYISISPDGKNVYGVVNTIGGGVVCFDRNTSTGALSNIRNVSTGNGPSWLSVSPDGLSVYVTNKSSNNLTRLTRNLSTGNLTNDGSIGVGNSPSSVVVSGDNKNVYVVNDGSNSIYQFSRNTSDGSLSALTPATITNANPMYGIVISNDGASVYITNAASSTVLSYSRNATTGLLTALNPLTIATVGANPYNLSISKDGRNVYTSDLSGNYISIFNRSTVFSIGAAFTQARTGLPSGSTIHYRGYATNSIGTGYSSDSTFVTP